MAVPSFIAKILSSSNSFLGTGVLVAETHLLTANHVVKNGRSFTVIGHSRQTRANIVARDTENDIALLSLDVALGHPPLWSTEDPHQRELHLYGFEQGDFRDVTGHNSIAHHNEQRMIVRVESSCGAPEGMSGGVATRLINGTVFCVGLICLGGVGASQSILLGGGLIAPFLAKHDVPLPGWSLDTVYPGADLAKPVDPAPSV